MNNTLCFSMEEFKLCQVFEGSVNLKISEGPFSHMKCRAALTCPLQDRHIARSGG